MEARRNLASSASRPSRPERLPPTVGPLIWCPPCGYYRRFAAIHVGVLTIEAKKWRPRFRKGMTSQPPAGAPDALLERQAEPLVATPQPGGENMARGFAQAPGASVEVLDAAGEVSNAPISFFSRSHAIVRCARRSRVGKTSRSVIQAALAQDDATEVRMAVAANTHHAVRPRVPQSDKNRASWRPCCAIRA